MVLLRKFLRYHVNNALLQREPPYMFTALICILVPLCFCFVAYILMFYDEICISWKETKAKRALMEVNCKGKKKKCSPFEVHSQRMKKESRKVFKQVLSEIELTLAINSDDESSGEDKVVVTKERPTAVVKYSYVEASASKENVTFQCMVDETVVESKNKFFQYVNYQAITTTDIENGEVIGKPSINNIINTLTDLVRDSFRTCLDNFSKNSILKTTSIDEFRREMEKVD
ncbi:uncharacterized protein LOC119662263 [Teleopsis dalmanni]|uniref:uncharacterized protein LOC119662263 n=1 Tax=Teleopsis dalmanni TaxID=139649 RepID=UPI0018CEC0B5|nr:uncharacterized protein LOC119662263 [Teleopsis dalmanni]XP_037927781.1 uncharacterized protein LOC119662263 [Teleopsis dalmanni]XP_037927782.1 uncharacterized protein LOC119662263 [Teleopsis dalmanni]XP_037927783.1 uncharacterized protein LOC119662263 [Teleopsis dalmanni]XP_037927784.1 uncharacterized protein LOC119662263 [Teleopsis dalmanni]